MNRWIVALLGMAIVTTGVSGLTTTASAQTAQTGTMGRVERHSTPPANVVKGWASGQQPALIETSGTHMAPARGTVPYTGLPRTFQIPRGRDDLLKSVTSAGAAAPAPSIHPMSTSYPDCSWYYNYPCIRHSNGTIDYQNGAWQNRYQLGPYNSVNPCAAGLASPCTLSSQASASLTVTYSTSLKIDGETVKWETGFNIGAQIQYQQSLSIQVPQGHSGGIYPYALADVKTYAGHNDNYLCSAVYDAMGNIAGESCSLYSTTYGNVTVTNPENGVNWYTWVS